MLQLCEQYAQDYDFVGLEACFDLLCKQSLMFM